VSLTPGFSEAEILEYVLEYQRLPYGSKGAWLKEQSFTKFQFRRWQAAVFGGDLGLGLVPRDSKSMTSAGQPRRDHAREIEERAGAGEIERLRARINELEEVNDALGKAIGLLHQRSVHEPDEHLPTPNRSPSS